MDRLPEGVEPLRSPVQARKRKPGKGETLIVTVLWAS